MNFLVIDECYHILLQEVGLESMKICVKDLSGLGSSHDISLDCQLRCYWRLFINFPIVIITISRIIVIFYYDYYYYF